MSADGGMSGGCKFSSSQQSAVPSLLAVGLGPTCGPPPETASNGCIVVCVML
eukprot:CAMPEP_0174376882 /NCGR_PEP_ID=MMETSP0811_2-20130205/119939_1 /TAXON_ID=73025 ORGANISM="Eutreptiella gymnastica-like, Strain CCMP1594" /NCGR_SAMPLE_ID=MMETSP0811_2 /ASSEMBLY_ACC=CAM_ASM_000667 /LENGTH=51 /DNA_ID=CAMNT_0015528575 /DNA_START=642 /DNA_END=797 /DNA_ORIENTATION=-